MSGEERIHAEERIIHSLESIGRVSGIEFAVVQEDHLTPIFGMGKGNPIVTSLQLRNRILTKSRAQDPPLIALDPHGVAFGCVRTQEAAFLFGPMPIKSMNRMEVHAYCVYYDVDARHERLLRSFTADQIISVTRLAAGIITGKDYSDEELVSGNGLQHISDEEIRYERVLQHLREEEREIYHHTFAEELEILSCVKEGKAEEVRKKSMATDRKMGRLSRNELTHWKYAAIVAITLCARMAMQSGVTPATAYHISDYFIQKLDDCNSVAAVVSLRNKAVCDLTEQVNQKSQNRVEGYVDQCIDYIAKHYREKIYLENLAEGLGLSANYISKLFARETGTRLQDDMASSKASNASSRESTSLSSKSMASVTCARRFFADSTCPMISCSSFL